MKILFIGSVKSSECFLKSIIENTNAEIVGIVTKVNSKYNSDHVSLSDLAIQYNIDWINYEGNSQLIDWILMKEPDIIYCFGWSYLLPKEVYSLPKLGAVGYHPTLLPKNRGRHPIIWTLVLGLKETGSTFFYLTETPDAGDIISQIKVEVKDNETAATLYEKLLIIGEKQVVHMTEGFIYQKIQSVKQNDSQANYWRKRGKKDGLIDWRMNAKSILKLVNALTKPYMGAHFEYNSLDIIIWKAEIIDVISVDENIEPGKIVKVDGQTFTVKTADGLLKVIEYEGVFNPRVGEYL